MSEIAWKTEKTIYAQFGGLGLVESKKRNAFRLLFLKLFTPKNTSKTDDFHDVIDAIA